MDVGDIIKSESHWTLASRVLPGAITITPYILLLFHFHPNLLEFFNNNAVFSTTLLLLFSLAVGFVLEDFGAWLETLWDKILNNKANSRHFDEWKDYLNLKYENPSIGQKYLETIVLRMKFELGVGLAIIPLWIGFLCYNIVTTSWSWYPFSRAVVVTGSYWCV